MRTNFCGWGFSDFGDISILEFNHFSWTVVHGSEKIEPNRIGSKNLCKYVLMCSACVPILVGGVSLVSEILLL